MQKANDLVWRGRIQLGDEPGIYSDSQYGGLCLELPIEFLPYPNVDPDVGGLTVEIEAQEVKIYEGFKGHPVTLFAVEVDDNGKWVRRWLGSGELNNENEGHAEITLNGEVPHYAVIRVESNSELPPGLYDEIVVCRLSIKSTAYYGYLGFRFPNPADR